MHLSKGSPSLFKSSTIPSTVPSPPAINIFIFLLGKSDKYLSMKFFPFSKSFLSIILNIIVENSIKGSNFARLI